jgi:hypothetical protein
MTPRFQLLHIVLLFFDISTTSRLWWYRQEGSTLYAFARCLCLHRQYPIGVSIEVLSCYDKRNRINLKEQFSILR